jgi:hypothetical protein
MYPVSAAFKDRVRQSHQMMLRCEIWQGGSQVATVYPISGMVEIDARRTSRRTVSVTLAAENGLVPGVNPSALTPYGNELYVWRGVRVPSSVQVEKTYNGLATAYATVTALDNAFVTFTDLEATILVEVDQDEWVPQGVFFLTEVDVQSGDGATITLRGVDRSIRILRNSWTSRYQTEAGDTLDQVLIELLRNRWPQVETDFPEIATVVPRRVFGLDSEDDPWTNAQDLATAAGYDLFFDQNGVAVLRSAPAYDIMEPQETYEENSEAMVLGVSRGLNNERSYNVVVVIGEGSRQNQVYRGRAEDLDPLSPTYIYGPYGQYPLVYNASSINSVDEANEAATLLLSRTKGLVEAFEWSQIVDPSLDAGDYIRVTNTLANVSRSFVIDRLTVPLGPNEPMTAVARTLRIDGQFDEELDG